MTNSKRNRKAFQVDELEPRSLLSGFHHGIAATALTSHTSAAVQADLAKIKVDQQALQTAVTTLAPTLQADQQAIQTAIAASTTIQTAKTQLTTDTTTWTATLKADKQAIKAATNSTTRAADILQLQTDATSAAKALKTDATALQSAIANDPGVQAAKTKLQSDAAPITQDEATLQADLIQLQKDLKAQIGGTVHVTGHPHGHRRF
jgi:hypothetical protein